MKANSDKSHLLLSTEENLNANINGDIIPNSKSEKLLGVTIDCKLNFDEHVSRLCDKASQKLNALARIASFMKTEQKRKIMKAFISSQFGYCSLVWMFCSRRLNSRINRIQERALRTVYNDKSSTYPELLEKDSSVSIHCRNLQVLATEIFKSKNNLSPPVMQETFKIIEPNYNLRRNTIFQNRKIRTEKYGTASLTYLAPKIWELVPNDIKLSNSLEIFKSKIKNWETKACPCKICKTFVPSLGYL